jgi:hypothetical protein
LRKGNNKYFIMLKYNILRTFLCLISTLFVLFIYPQSITFNKGMVFQDSLLQESATQILEVDDGFIISGFSDMDRYKLVISKLDSMGDAVWLKKYGDERYFYEPGHYDAMIRTSDSNFALAANFTDYWLSYPTRMMIMKFDKNGDTLWSHQLYSPDSVDEYCSAGGIIETFDKGFLVYGNEGGLTGVMIKTDSLGMKEWMTYYGNHQVSNCRQIHCVRQTSDSGYIAGGYQADLHSVTSGDARIVKFDKNGTVKWDKGFGSDYHDYTGAYVQPAGDGNFMIITHHTTETSGNPNWVPQKNKLQIIKITENGDVLLNVLRGDEEKYLYISDMEVLPDGSFIASGRDIWGSISWMFNFEMEKDSLFFRMINPPGRIDTLRDITDIKSSSDGGIIACGDYDTPISGEYIRHPWLIKTDRYGCFNEGCDPNGIYAVKQPAPATTCKNQQTTLSLETYNSSGNVSYSWQNLHSGTWQNIDDSIIYKGFRDDTLIINPGYIDQPQEYYRCNYYNEVWTLYSDSVIVDFLDTLTISSQPENQSVHYGGPASLIILAEGERPVDYQWYHDTLALEGSTDSILHINSVYEADTGTYFCILTNACGNISTETVRLSISDLGIIDEPGLQGISISPNPTSRFLRISSFDQIFIESVILTDINGKPLSEKQFGKKDRLNFEADLNDLPAGIYFLILKTDHERIARKILKL